LAGLLSIEVSLQQESVNTQDAEVICNTKLSGRSLRVRSERIRLTFSRQYVYLPQLHELIFPISEVLQRDQSLVVPTR